MSRDPRWLVRVDQLYGLALFLYPRRFRDGWEQPMRQAFRDRCREVARGQRTVLALVLELVPDLALGVGREHFNAMEHEDMFKRHLLAGLVALFCATLLLRGPIGEAVFQAQQWGVQRSERLDEEARRAYWTDLAGALEGDAKTPRDQAVLGIAWSEAAKARQHVAADPASQSRAQAHWDAAVTMADPPALWLSVLDCPVGHCDADAAFAALSSQDPANGALQLLALQRTSGLASRDGALAALAASRYFHGYEGDLLKSLLRVDDRASLPMRLRHHSGWTGQEGTAGQIAAVWSAWAQPRGFHDFLDACAPGNAGAPIAAACIAAAKVMADGDALMPRIVGLRVMNRFADGDPQAREVRQRLRDFHWVVRNYSTSFADMPSWRAAWLASNGEVDAVGRMLAARGIETSAPGEFQVAPRWLDPGR
jgi:hypothetical protein